MNALRRDFTLLENLTVQSSFKMLLELLFLGTGDNEHSMACLRVLTVICNSIFLFSVHYWVTIILTYSTMSCNTHCHSIIVPILHTL